MTDIFACDVCRTELLGCLETGAPLPEGACARCGLQYSVLYRMRNALDKPFKQQDGPAQFSIAGWHYNERRGAFVATLEYRVRCYDVLGGMVHIRLPNADVCVCGNTMIKRDVRGTVTTFNRPSHG